MDMNHCTDAEGLLRFFESIQDQSATELQKNVINYLLSRTNAENGFMLLVSQDEEELSCRVIGNKVLDEEVKLPSRENIYTLALSQKCAIRMDHVESTFHDQVTDLMECSVRSFLCVPVSSPGHSERIVLLMCLVNKIGEARFTQVDELAVREFFRHTCTLLLNTVAFEEERRLRLQCQSLLRVARNLFSHLDDVTKLLKEIMSEARNLTKAERCSLFLLDKENNELVAKVFDGNLPEDCSESADEVRIPANQGIAGHVATTGELLNIKDAYSHPLFYRGMDETTGFKTRNILCFPIKDENGVIGIAELCNKINGLQFSRFDEEIALGFAVYCGISIMHSLMYKKVRDAQHRSRLSNELMMYHMKVTNEDVTKLLTARIPPPCEFDPNFDSFAFTPRSLSEGRTPLAVISMFEDLGMVNRWKIKHESLVRFTLMVRRGYRDPPYHNWWHAFSTCHFCYLLLKNLRLMDECFLSELEGFALIVACMCHDLDHRGTTNSFQVQSQSVLAALYSSEGSVMERHHFAQAMCILNTDGCNLLESMSRKEYTKALDCIRDIILATDLAHHLRIVKELQQMAHDGYVKADPVHHRQLLCLLMTACDLSDQTKDWKSTKKIAELVYREFFSQGDLEKAIGNQPSEMMDRERACIPELQINFLSDIALPVYVMISQMFPEAHSVSDMVATNQLYWERLRDAYRKRHRQPSLPDENSAVQHTGSSLDILDDEELDAEVMDLCKNPRKYCKVNYSHVVIPEQPAKQETNLIQSVRDAPS